MNALEETASRTCCAKDGGSRFRRKCQCNASVVKDIWLAITL